MCIHTHTDSKLMRGLTAQLLALVGAVPLTLVNTKVNPHEHFTLYARREGKIRAAKLLNARHPEYAGRWSEDSVNLFGFLDGFSTKARDPLPSVEWPDAPSAPFVATVCYAYGTMTENVPTVTDCVDYAMQMLIGKELSDALNLIEQIRGPLPVVEAVPESFPTTEATIEEQLQPARVAVDAIAANTAQKRVMVVYFDVDSFGGARKAKYPEDYGVEFANGALVILDREGRAMAAYAQNTWERVRWAKVKAK